MKKSRFNDQGLVPPSAVRALCDYCATHIAPGDIERFAPSDPGYDNYVRVWSVILETGTVPAGRRYRFELTEVIGLTGWVDAGAEVDPTALRRFAL